MAIPRKVKILYDGSDPFNSDETPTPFLSFDKEFIKYGYDEWGQKYNINLKGQLVGELGPTAMQSLEDLRDDILTSFRKDYKRISVLEDGVEVFGAENCCVESIDFDSSRYYGLMDYTINISAYDFRNNIVGGKGIIDPEESWDFSENEDGVISISHSISAAGTPIDGKAGFEIARDWVRSKDSLPPSLMSTIRVKQIDAQSLLLDSMSEQVNRFQGTYSIVRNYLVDAFHGSSVAGKGILRYTVDGSKDFSSEDQLVTVTIQGSVVGKSDTNPVDMGDLRDRMESLNFADLASEVAVMVDPDCSINRAPVSASISENPNDSEITFSYKFNDDENELDEAICDYSVNVSDNLIKNIIDLTINASIISNKGDKSKRWQLVLDYYNSKFNALSLAQAEYRKFGYSRNLNSIPVSETITFDEFNYKIDYTASWSDKYLPCPNVLSSITETVNFSPSIRVHVPKPSLLVNGEHNVQFFGCASRGTFSTEIQGVGKSDSTIDAVRSCVMGELSRIKSKYLSGC